MKNTSTVSGTLYKGDIVHVDKIYENSLHIPTIKVFEVHSKHGKALRAEPIVLAYEQQRVHHIGYLAELEDQMTSWIPGETSQSPDRVDALVHALTALLIKPPQGFVGGKLTAKSPAARRIPGIRGGYGNGGARVAVLVNGVGDGKVTSVNGITSRIITY